MISWIVKICVTFESPFSRNVKKNMFYIKEEFSIWCIVSMSIGPAAQNKTKILIFLCTNFLLLCRHKQKKFLGALPLIPTRALSWTHLWAYSTPRCLAVYKRCIWTTDQLKRHYFNHCSSNQWPIGVAFCIW